MPVFKVSKDKLILLLAAAAAAKSLQSCPPLCDPTDSSPPGSSVPGILQARILEWVAISFSRGSFQPRNRTLVSCIAGRFFTNWAMRKALYNDAWSPMQMVAEPILIYSFNNPRALKIYAKSILLVSYKCNKAWMIAYLCTTYLWISKTTVETYCSEKEVPFKILKIYNELNGVFMPANTISWRRKWQPSPVFLPGESQGQRSLVGCRLWGRAESDMTEAT